MILSFLCLANDLIVHTLLCVQRRQGIMFLVSKSLLSCRGWATLMKSMHAQTLIFQEWHIFVLVNELVDLEDFKQS